MKTSFYHFFYLLIVGMLVIGSTSCSSYKVHAGSTVSDVIAFYHVPYTALVFNDDPPGKLRAVSFTQVVSGERKVCRVVIDPDSRPFSADRAWTEVEVRGAIVSRVVFVSE